MKQIILQVSKLDNAIGYAAKSLMAGYTRAGAIELLQTIKSQFNDNFDLAAGMYGERMYNRVCHTLSSHELVELLSSGDMRAREVEP